MESILGQIGRLEGGPCPTIELELASHMTPASTITYAAFERTAINVTATQLADSHSRVLMSVHLDESEAAVRLKARLGHISEILK